MDSLFDVLIGKSLSGGSGGGGGGISNYNALENKPQINGTTLTGNKSLSDLGIAAASDIPTVNNGTLTIQKNGTLVNTFKANQASDVTVNITVPTTAADVSALPSSTKYAAALSLTINSSTYVVTGQLKDQNGNNLGSAQTIDLPLETMVVGGSYDDEHKKIVLTLKNGNTVDIPVADLVSGLQTELSATNKLNPAYINYDSTHAAVTDAEKTTWSGKQDALTFDGTYSASTNKAATVSTVTNAINALDVTGASGISAAKTISAWSETNGKVSISTQDIAIAGTQAVLTGYQKSTTAGQAVAATDNVNQAIGKVEKRVSDNENNISYNTNNGVKNIWNVTIPSNLPSGFTITRDSDGGFIFNGNTGNSAVFCTTQVWFGTEAYVLSGCPSGGSDDSYRFDILRGDNSVICYGDPVVARGFTQTTSYTCRIRIAANYTCNNLKFYPMICLKSLYDADPTYQPHALSNAELTAKEQTNENNILLNWTRGRNLSPWNSGSKSSAGFIVQNSPIDLSAGTYYYTLKMTATSGQTQITIGEAATPAAAVTVNNAATTFTGSFTIANAQTKFSIYSSSANAISDFMIITQADYNAGLTDYQPYALSNVELTAAIQALQAQLANQ